MSQQDYTTARNQFRKNTDQKEEIEAWENGLLDSFRGDIKGIIPSMGKSVFQMCFDPDNTKFEFTTLLEETDEYIVIVPAGYRSDRAPTYKTTNPPMSRIGGNSALMSLVHVLVIPKRRIYNALTLWKKDIPLVKKMQSVADKWVRYLSTADDRVPFSKAWMLDGLISANPELQEEFKIVPEDMSLVNNSRTPFCLYGTLHPDNVPVATTFHINHSIGWLHMHGFANNLLTTGYDIHHEKNVSVDSVLVGLEELQETSIHLGMGTRLRGQVVIKHIQVEVNVGPRCEGGHGTIYNISYKYDNLTNKMLKKIDEQDGWGEIIYKNEMTEKMVEYLLMDEEELSQYSGYTNPSTYKLHIMKCISLLWD
jgi:hypothetical protein